MCIVPQVYARLPLLCATTNSVTFEKIRIFKVLRFVVRRFIASLRKSYLRYVGFRHFPLKSPDKGRGMPYGIHTVDSLGG